MQASLRARKRTQRIPSARTVQTLGTPKRQFRRVFPLSQYVLDTVASKTTGKYRQSLRPQASGAGIAAARRNASVKVSMASSGFGRLTWLNRS